MAYPCSSNATNSRSKESRISHDQRSKSERRTKVASPILNGPVLKVKGVLDQDRQHYIQVKSLGRRAIIPLKLHMERPSAFYDRLLDLDIVIQRGPSRQEVEVKIGAILDWTKVIYAVKHPGYHDGTYVLPSGRIAGPKPKRFIVALDGTPLPLGQAGSLAGWQATIRHFVDGQATFSLAACIPFVGPLLELLSGALNVGIELTGPSSIGKTTALDIAASVWGAPHDGRGTIATSMRSTDNGLEQAMLARAGTFLPMNESNLAGMDRGSQVKAMFNAAFMLNEGVSKERYNDPAAPAVKLAFLVTSNLSIHALLEGYNDENAAGATVRLLTVPADAGKSHGAFNHLPDGHDGSREATAALNAALHANYGHAAPAFLRRLARDRRANEKKLIRRIRMYQALFLKDARAADADHQTARKADAFGLIYAAGKLAQAYGILPLTQLRSAILECFMRSLGASASGHSPLDRVRDYVAQNRPSLIDLDTVAHPYLKKETLNAHPGFLLSRKGRQCLLVRKAKWDAEFGQQGYAMLSQLRAAGKLQITKGFQLQVKVRKHQATDRVYAIVLGH